MKLKDAERRAPPAIRAIRAATVREHIGLRAPARGLTLIELLVTLIIFLVMAIFMMMAVREVTLQWGQGERRRVLYEKAGGVVNTIADDLRLALTQEPAGATEVKARFISDFEPNTENQRLMFVRSFEAGPERALTANAGDGIANDLAFKPEDPDAPPQPAPTHAPDTDNYTGMKVGDFKALGGMAAVAYFVKDRVLYRAIRAPVPNAMTDILDPKNAQAVATDVLYFSFDYWGQTTQSWSDPGKGKGGPERIWDSTRGIKAPPLNRFFLHRGPESLNDSEDDVFPQKVRFTITVDSPLPRCVNTKLLDEISEGETTIFVDNTQGFSDGGEDSYILIDDEWIQFKRRNPECFVVSRRGARGTTAKGHAANAVVRTGKTFRRVVFIPNYREDLTPDDVYYARKDALANKPKRLVR